MIGSSPIKIDGGNGKFYTRDHPKEIISEHVMRFEEIRGWFRELSTNPDYGWTSFGGRAGLSRALGMGPGSLSRRLSAGWIWPREQVKFTHRIRAIVEGNVVPVKRGRQVHGVYVHPPQPPQLTRREIKLRAILPQHLNGGRVKLVSHPLAPPPQIPDFKNAFKHVPLWDPDKKRAGG